MKKILSLIIISVITIVLVKGQTEQEDFWTLESIMEGTMLAIELPVMPDVSDTSMIKNPPFTLTLYSGIYEKAQPPILERVKTHLVERYMNINPDQIVESTVHRMFNQHWNYYYQERHDGINLIENFNITKHHLSLIHHKLLTEINLICDKTTSTLFLNRIIYDAHKVGNVKKINIGIISSRDRRVWFKPLSIDQNTYINPFITFADWVNSGFELEDKKSETPMIIEVPE